VGVLQSSPTWGPPESARRGAVPRGGRVWPAGHVCDLPDPMQRERGKTARAGDSSPWAAGESVQRSELVTIRRRGVLASAVLNLDLAPPASITSLELGAPEMMTLGRRFHQASQFKARRCFVREGVADDQPPAVRAGGCRSLVTQGYRAPGERRYLPEFEGQRATFDLLSVGRDNHHAGSPAHHGGNPQWTNSSKPTQATSIS
jgi:hypothetical protein